MRIEGRQARGSNRCMVSVTLMAAALALAGCTEREPLAADALRRCRTTAPVMAGMDSRKEKRCRGSREKEARRRRRRVPM